MSASMASCSCDTSCCKGCQSFTGAHPPVPRELSLAEIRQNASRISHHVLADWTKLNAILKRFEVPIRKRWLRKNHKQRRGMLVQAWPDIPYPHRPDYMGFRNKALKTPKNPKECYIWPHINIEGLQQGHLLLLFLNSRGRYLPETFIHADDQGAYKGHGWCYEAATSVAAEKEAEAQAKTAAKDEQEQEREIEKEEEEENEFATPPGMEVAMRFDGPQSPKRYGRVVHNCGARDVPTTQPYYPIRGLFVLEIQQQTYSFLLKCAKLILHDVDPKQYFLAPHQPPPHRQH